MQNPIQTLIESRASTNHFDAARKLSDSEIAALVGQATRAPSAYNLQNWRFIAVRTDAAKARLKDVAYGQQKVMDAAVTFIICGTLNAYAQLPEILRDSVDAGALKPSVVDSWVAMARNTYHGNLELQRDEAIRSASLAAMTLMLAAEGMGLATCPMTGFDPHGVAEVFQLASTEVPVIMVTVGYPDQGNRPQKPRRALGEVIKFA